MLPGFIVAAFFAIAVMFATVLGVMGFAVVAIIAMLAVIVLIPVMFSVMVRIT